MKIIPIIAIAFLSILSFHASAADRNYIVSDTESQQKIDIYNDGRSTYIQAVPGLVIRGATADGERLIIRDVPNVINAELGGKKITLARGNASPVIAPSKIITASLMKKFQSTESEISERLNRLEKESALLDQDAKSKKETVTKTAAINTETATAAELHSAPTWTTSPTDVNLRLLIGRWATSASWNSVWDADIDSPITGKDQITTDFKTAIRHVLSSTELGDSPLKPCFYTNNVVRVVRQSAKCNPSE